MELPHKAFCLALDLKVCDQQSFAFVWDFASSILLSLATSLWRVKAEWRAVLFAQRFSIALYWCYCLECSTRDKLWYLITLIVNWLTTLSIIFVDYIARGSMQWLLSKEGWKLQRSWRLDTHCFREHCATQDCLIVVISPINPSLADCCLMSSTFDCVAVVSFTMFVQKLPCSIGNLLVVFLSFES